MGLFAQILGAFLGLALVLLVGGAFGWVEPLWWGGKALSPLIFGGIVLAVGGIPYFLITWLIFYFRSRNVTSKRVFLVGMIQGITLVPLSFIAMIVFRSYFYQGELTGLLPVWSALGVAGILATASGAWLISTFIKK